MSGILMNARHRHFLKTLGSCHSVKRKLFSLESTDIYFLHTFFSSFAYEYIKIVALNSLSMV